MNESSKAVFLSYAREDADAAKRIAEALRGFGQRLPLLCGQVEQPAAALLAPARWLAVLLAGLAYWRGKPDNVGLTTEIALMMTVLLGGLSVTNPVVAAGVGVVVAILLASRAYLHDFVRSVMTAQELRDGLLLAAATLVVLPILPNENFGPYEVLNPYLMWTIVIMVMLIGAGGHVAVRLFGMEYGLALTGFASGFISSTATIRDMAQRARADLTKMNGAVAGASLSSVSTAMTMLAALALTNLPTFKATALPLMAACLASAIYALPWVVVALRGHVSEPSSDEQVPQSAAPSRAISLKGALSFSAALAAILVASTAIQQAFGPGAMIVAAALAGLVNTQSAAITVALSVGAGQIEAHEAVLPVLAAITTNTLVRITTADGVEGQGGAGGDQGVDEVVERLQRRVTLARDAENVDAGEAIDIDVAEDERKAIACDHLQCIIAIVSDGDRIALRAKEVGNRGGDRSVVVNHEDRGLRHCYSFGNVMVNREPAPGWLSTEIRPPCCSTISLTSARPIPVPSSLPFSSRFAR